MNEQKAADAAEQITFSDNRHVAALCGVVDSHLVAIENATGVRIDARGNRLNLTGPAAARRRVRKVLESLYRRIERGETPSLADVETATRLADEPAETAFDPALTVRTSKRPVFVKTPAQGAYLAALRRADLVFGVGPAGTGKTYLAVAHAVSLLVGGRVDRIVLSRPAVEAGERIGFLPGDIKEKVDPYLRPLYDALGDMLPTDYIERRIASGEIEIAPLAFMRGRTLARAAVILDEAQNSTVAQMKMFLTRLGEGAHMTITGDPTQSDLPRGEVSGLGDALGLLADIEGVEIARFTAADVVRHPLVTRIIAAYDARAERRP